MAQEGLSWGTPHLFPPFSTQKVLSEEEIDENFKALFRQLAGEVGWGLGAGGGWGTLSRASAILALSLGPGDQRQGAADHPEQNHQQT